ncbi:adenylate kinase [Coemansia reversa NRRL 1564]|uniref:GTP:AMP phosphotransferase, mitochondrial n=1 Tax=Coemansia reversa (strain ATCC 12441 / NRRL 1564) TaxID=763665 RepID=A0A2G5BIY6_COERN|nr:adenylate kinase [Coemansia reversa NRRL 1564]|eukprot:PIA18966.1 adenylate kinase [Coemansia reversa NRRL 1564]
MLRSSWIRPSRITSFVYGRAQASLRRLTSISSASETTVDSDMNQPTLQPQQKQQQMSMLRGVSLNGTPLRMLILGAPGAGKGTQSARVRQNFDITAISSGDVLRRNIAEQTMAGRRAQAAVASGSLVSDEIIVELIHAELNNIAGRSWLLDGFPRSIIQARALDSMLEAVGQPLNAVVNLDVPESVILQRIIERYVHVSSGRVYNLTYNPPKVPGIDDVTGEPLEHRPDDNPESFKRRLEQYHALTEPLLNYYHSTGVLTSFSGSTSDIIFPQFYAYLDQRFE